MTDKEQIIIDGVDVKDCRRRIGKNSYCRYFKRLCSENNFNCVWKQLARKTQECEQYKKRAVCFKDVNKQLGYKYLTIKQECEELKEENQKLEMQLCNDCGERDDYNIPCKMIRDLDYGLQKEIEENDRYRKALEEIEKEIRDFQCDNCEDYHCETCDMKDILDIINKAKGERNAI